MEPFREEPAGATLHRRPEHDIIHESVSTSWPKKARKEQLTSDHGLQPYTIPGPCDKKASSDLVTAPLGDLEAIPYLDSTSTASASTRPWPGLACESEVPLICSGRLPLSTTVSSMCDTKDGDRINKLLIVDKPDGNFTKKKNIDESVHQTPSHSKKQRLASPGVGHTLNKHGIPLTPISECTMTGGSRPPDTRLERSLRKDGEDKDSRRKLPASRADRLRAPNPSTESHARGRERSRSAD